MNAAEIYDKYGHVPFDVVILPERGWAQFIDDLAGLAINTGYLLGYSPGLTLYGTHYLPGPAMPVVAHVTTRGS